MRNSFSELPIPTIVEEEEQSIVEGDDQAAIAPASVADKRQFSEKGRKSRDASVPTDIHKARQSLGMVKSQRNAKHNTGQRSINEIPSGGRKISKAPCPKKRHVFAFEKIGAPSTLHTQSEKSCMPDGRDRTQAPPTRERDKLSTVSKKIYHDDWIQGFDVQMKCAMNRLKDLV